MAVIYQNGKLLTMGSEDHGKLGHTIREKSLSEIQKDKESYKKHGF